MTIERRPVVIGGGLLLAVALTAALLVLRDSPDPPSYREQACALPSPTLELATRSVSAERSGDIVLLSHDPVVFRNNEGDQVVGAGPDIQRIPLVFRGRGAIRPQEATTTASLADIAPTIAVLLRGSFQAEGGRALGEVARLTPSALTRPPPRLVLTVVWGGVGAEILEATRGDWPHLAQLAREGVSYPRASVGSLFPARATVATTVGTGSFPANHGVTGSFVRVDDGAAVEAFGRGGPAAAPALLPTLGERWQSVGGAGSRAKTGVLGTIAQDTAFLPNGRYVYTSQSTSEPATVARSQTDAVKGLVDRTGFGADGVTDLLTVIYPAVEVPETEGRLDALTDNVHIDDDELGRLTSWLDRRIGAHRWVLVLTADRGRSMEEEQAGIEEQRVARAIDEEFGPVTEALSDGQVFLGRAALASSDASVDDVASWLIGRTLADLDASVTGEVDASDPAFELAVPTATLLEVKC